MVTRVGIDIHLNKVEDLLSMVAVVPGVGILAGVTKVTLGFCQVVTGVLIEIWCRTFVRRVVQQRTGTSSSTNTKHGLGNIMAGSLEALPLVGAAIYLARIIKRRRIARANEQARAYIAYGFNHKWMPYHSLLVHSYTLEGRDSDLKKTIIARQRELRGDLTIRNASSEARLLLLQQALAQVLADELSKIEQHGSS